MSNGKQEEFSVWMAGLSARLRGQGNALRLSLTAADSEVLADPAAGAADAISRAAGASARLEVSIPESADQLIDLAVNALLKQGLRLLQLEYEKDATEGARFVAVFAPSRADQTPAQAAFILRNEQTAKTWELKPEKPLLLGRADDCAVRVASPQASNQHCSISFARRAFMLIDLRSSAGTFLHNRPMRRGVVQEFGRICLGRKETGHYLEMELRIPPGDVAFLHVINGANAGTTISLVDQVITVGRAPGCQVQIDAPYISREHLRIMVVTDCYLLTDLASTNGTLHNGRPVCGGRLVPGDRIEVGEDSFTFHAREELDGFFQPGWRIEAGDRAVLLDRPFTTIGRNEDCDFLTGESRLSRRHARLVWEQPGHLKLYDLASFGGTAVAGRLVANAELRGGEVLKFGPVQARIAAPK